MGFIFELIFEIILEGSIEGIKNGKIPMWIRIVCAIFVSTIFLFVIGIIGILAIKIWNDYYHIPSILFLILDLALVILIIKKIKKGK
jgi:hypothetical protein